MELVDSVDELRSSSSTRGISMPNFEVLDARIASALNKIIHNSHFKRRISLRNQRPRRRTVSFAQDRLLTWSVSTSGSQEPTILSRITPTYLRLVFEMTIFRNYFIVGRNSIINDENPTWWYLGRTVQIKKSRVWETQDRIGIVQYGDSSEAGPDYHRLKTYRAESTNQ